jgi:PTS system nitrogen regulatory IIA component
MDKTFLTVRDLSTKLGVSEKTVYRMVNARAIPFAIKISGQWRFNSEKIDKWIASKNNAGIASGAINDRLSLADALTEGLIIYRAHGKNRDELLDEILAMTSLSIDGGTLSIKRQILYAESIISSSLKGVSFMAPDPDGSGTVNATMLLAAFLEKPMNFKAIDHVDTKVVFVLLAANKTEQLIIKTKLMRLLMEEKFISLLKEQPNRRVLLQRIAAMEAEICGEN